MTCPKQAFHHAVAGDDLELGVQIFEHYRERQAERRRAQDIASWLESLPEEWYAAYPLLGLARAGFLAFTGAL